MWKGLDPSGTPGCEVRPRPARGEAASGWLPRDGLDSPETAGCSRHDSPGGRRGGDGRPRPEFLCVQPSRHRLGPGPQPRHGGDPCPAASHAAAAERVSAARAAEPGLVPLALWPPSRGAQPDSRWARPSSPAPGRPSCAVLPFLPGRLTHGKGPRGPGPPHPSRNAAALILRPGRR